MMAHTGTLRGRHGMSRTVVLHPPYRSIRDHVIKIFQRLPAPVRAAGIWIRKPKIIITLVVILAALSTIVIYYYLRFANEIDARLNRRSLDDAVEIVTAPLKLSLGDRLPIDDLTDYLRNVGYQQRTVSSDEN